MTTEQLKRANELAETLKNLCSFVTCEEWSSGRIIGHYEGTMTIDLWEDRNNLPEGREYAFHYNLSTFKHFNELRIVQDEVIEAIMNTAVTLRKRFNEI